MINKKGNRVLFCYRCNRHVEPEKKRTESSMYIDYEGNPIIDNLSFCPHCHNEVHDPDYEIRIYQCNNKIAKDVKYCVIQRSS